MKCKYIVARRHTDASEDLLLFFSPYTHYNRDHFRTLWELHDWFLTTVIILCHVHVFCIYFYLKQFSTGFPNHFYLTMGRVFATIHSDRCRLKVLSGC
jgi:hypothetical protein